MDLITVKIIETAIAFIGYFILRLITTTVIDRTVSNSSMQKTRGKIVKKALNFLWLLVVGAFVLIFWGVNQTQLVYFVSSVLTVIGIAMFAQWSILSNITAGVILFFNHSVKLDDTITIVDKDFNIEGRVSDIGLFFVTLKTEHNEKISIPNNVFIQKMIKQKSNE